MDDALNFLLGMAAIGVGLAWPIVVGVALYIYRKPLAQLFDGVGRRATKLAFFDFAIELATIPEFAPSWSVGADDVRKLSPAQIFDSGTAELFQQMAISPGSDYAVVDLGSGHEWLTSRLFIFAVMLARMRDLRCFVFVRKRGDVDRYFIGIATPDVVRWALARRYPWFELAYLIAYQNALYSAYPPLSADPKTVVAGNEILSMHGAMEWETARRLVERFVDSIQKDGHLSETSAEWVSVEQPVPLAAAPLVPWERAQWLDVQLLTDILNGAMSDSYFEDSPDIPAQVRAEAIARRKTAYVALVDKERGFKDLVDRQTLLEKLALYFAEQSAQGRGSSA